MQVTVTDLIGVPFLDGGRSLKGLDCWGLVTEVFNRYKIELPDYKISCLDAVNINSEIGKQRRHWKRCNEATIPVPALIVIKFNETIFCNHTGVYLGSNIFLHAREKIGVNIDRTDSPAWRRKIEGYYIPGWLDYEQHFHNYTEKPV